MLGRRLSCRCRAQVAICLWTSGPSEAVSGVPLPTWVSNPWQEELGLLSHALTPSSWLCHSLCLPVLAKTQATTCVWAVLFLP